MERALGRAARSSSQKLADETNRAARICRQNHLDQRKRKRKRRQSPGWRKLARAPPTQISYADTDPIYTIENYPNFFRVVPSENALSLARIPFIRHFNWTRVGTIYQNLPRYSLVSGRCLCRLD